MILSSAISAGGRHDTQGPAPNGSFIQVPARPIDSVEDEEQDRKILLPFSDDRSSLGGGEFCLALSVTSILMVLLKHHQTTFEDSHLPGCLWPLVCLCSNVLIMNLVIRLGGLNRSLPLEDQKDDDEDVH